MKLARSIRSRPLRKFAREKNILFHTDAVQAGAYLSLDVQELGVDLMSLGAHKFYGPKGIGVLYVRKGTPLVSQLTGGGQEFNLRAGTQNVPYIVGFAEALRLATEERQRRVEHVRPLRDQLIGAVLETIPDAQLTGHIEEAPASSCKFCVQGGRWQFAVDFPGCCGVCLFVRLRL